MEITIKNVPNVIFKTRVRDPQVEGPNPFSWKDVSTDDLFSGKKVVVFSLPGAFTPTCSTYQLPGFENMYKQFTNLGIDDIYCISVNDAFVMNAWAKDQKLENVKVIPDGSGHFTKGMGMLVDKDNLGFGLRSWRYAIVVDDGKIEQSFVEPGMMDNCPDDPYGETSPENILRYLKDTQRKNK